MPPLLYADDLLLISTTPAGLQRQLDRLGAYSAAWGLKFNADKTKVVVFEGRRGQAAAAAWRRAPAPLPTAAGPTFTCRGAALQTVEEFRYLGVQLHCRHAFSGAAAARTAAGGRRCA